MFRARLLGEAPMRAMGLRAGESAAIAEARDDDAREQSVNDVAESAADEVRATSPRPPRGGRDRGGRQSLRARAFLAVGGLVIAVTMWVVSWSSRKCYIGADPLFDKFAAGEQVILCFWHGRMVMMPFAYRGRGACIMNSRHRDGELISRAIRRFGIEVVHGSSTRGWVGGLKGLLAAHARGRDLVVVPDGPRGPRCRAKSGAIQLARATGTPIYPVSNAASRSHVLSRSWDWLAVPLPFARVAYVVEQPIEVPRDATPEQIEVLRGELEARLNRATDRADREVGVDPRHTREFVHGVARRGES
jgi:lysophospholipid acyltransferase (LPLAT)-like uncharacterized protein